MDNSLFLFVYLFNEWFVSLCPRACWEIPGDFQHGGHQVRGQPWTRHAARQRRRQRQPFLHRPQQLPGLICCFIVITLTDQITTVFIDRLSIFIDPDAATADSGEAPPAGQLLPNELGSVPTGRGVAPDAAVSSESGGGGAAARWACSRIPAGCGYWFSINF